MAESDKCGNDYDKTFNVIFGGNTYMFDSFECAISKLAPHCKLCDCIILGHGVEAHGNIYCCANCAYKDGVHELTDRAYYK